jgi:hypothetical protein
MTGPFSAQPSAEIFCLNHYLIKSHDEMVARRTRRQADAPRSAHSIEKWEWFDSFYNTVEDLRIQRFAAQLGEGAISQSYNPNGSDGVVPSMLTLVIALKIAAICALLSRG